MIFFNDGFSRGDWCFTTIRSSPQCYFTTTRLAALPQRDLHHNATTPQRDFPRLFGYPLNKFSTSFTICSLCRADLEQSRFKSKTRKTFKKKKKKPSIQKCCHIEIALVNIYELISKMHTKKIKYN